MILFETPYEDVLKTLFNELDKVRYFIDKNQNKIEKYFNNMMPENFLALKYTVPSSGNTYSIVSKVGLDGFIKTWPFLKVDGENGKKKVFVLRDDQIDINNKSGHVRWVLDIYTGHFLSRYKKRTGSVFNGDSLFIEFLMENNGHEIVIPARYVNPAINENDDRHFAIICEQGLCFSECDKVTVNGIGAIVRENKTFVGKNEVFFGQALMFKTVDYLSKADRLKKAHEEGADVDKMYEIIKSGSFDPLIFSNLN